VGAQGRGNGEGGKMIKKSYKFSTADNWFSIYIRLLNSENGYVQCCTCGKIEYWKSSTCGHFQKRGKPMTRFNEKNCAPQCVKCNGYNDGEQHKHAKYIDAKYGAGTADHLEALAGIRGQKLHTKFALKEIAKEYRLKAKALAKEKGISLK